MKKRIEESIHVSLGNGSANASQFSCGKRVLFSFIFISIFIFSFFHLVTAAYFPPQSAGDGSLFVTDDHNRNISYIYPSTGEERDLAYYGNTTNTLSVTSYQYGVLLTQELFDNAGNRLKFRDYIHPELTETYTYWPNGNLLSTTKNGASTDDFYNDNNQLVKEVQSIPSKHVVFPTDYGYDVAGRLYFIRNPQVNYTYTYYDYPDVLKDQLDTVYITNVVTGEASFLRYYYNLTNGNIIARVDNMGVTINYTYNDGSYPCQNVTCTTADPSSCSFVNTTCYYPILNQRTIGNFKVQVNYSPIDGTPISLSQLDSSGGVVKTYQPTITYYSGGTADGFLEQDSDHNYTYNPDGTLNQIGTIGSNGVATVSSTADGIVNGLAYSDGEAEKIYSDPNGAPFFDEDTVPAGGTTSTILTGAVIKNFFLNMFATITGHAITGHAIDDGIFENNDGSVTYSYVTSDSLDGEYIPLGDYNDMLANYTATYGPIPDITNQTLICNDSDGGIDEFDAGYTFFNNDYYIDNCTSNDTLQEYYCGRTIPIFGSVVIKSKSFDCQYGCMGGACLEAPIINGTDYANETCSAGNGVICSVNETCSGSQVGTLDSPNCCIGICNPGIEFPAEPSKPE